MANATVYFATNRQPNDPANPTDFDGGTVAPTPGDPLRFGRADFQGLDLTPEPDDDTDKVLDALGAQAKLTIAPIAVAPQSGDGDTAAELGAFAAIDQTIAGSRQDALCYIHGYDYTFRQSLARAAQLQSWYGQGPYGAPLLIFLLAWPSLGQAITPETYEQERNRARLSGDAMGRAMQRATGYARAIAAAQKTQQNVHMLAHSMGNWALRWAVQSLHGSGGDLPSMFDQVLLLAADEDDDTLSQGVKLQPMLSACNRVTVYCNYYDVPLGFSQDVMGNPTRLGAGGPANPKSLPAKVATASVASVIDPRIDEEQHQYFRDNIFVRRDLLQVLGGVADPSVVGRGHVLYNGQYVLTQAPGA